MTGHFQRFAMLALLLASAPALAQQPAGGVSSDPECGETTRTWADLDGDGSGDMGRREADLLGLGYDVSDEYDPSDVAAAIEAATRSVNRSYGAYSGQIRSRSGCADRSGAPTVSR